MACIVVTVNGDRNDSHAVRLYKSVPGAVKRALEMAIPDDGSEIRVYRVATNDEGAARLFLAPRKRVGSGRMVEDRYIQD